MAYVSSDLQLTPQSIAGKKKWHYASVDATSLVSATSYISDAVSKGVSAGDEISVYNSSTPKLTNYLVITLRSSIATGSADLSPGLITSS